MSTPLVEMVYIFECSNCKANPKSTKNVAPAMCNWCGNTRLSLIGEAARSTQTPVGECQVVGKDIVLIKGVWSTVIGK